MGPGVRDLCLEAHRAAVDILGAGQTYRWTLMTGTASLSRSIALTGC